MDGDFLKTNNKILKSSAVMAVATLTSRVLGLIREQAIAMMFGASFLTDAFWVAYRIPNMLRDLFAEGNFSSAFVPVLSEELNKSNRAGRDLFWSVFVLLLVITSIIATGVLIFSGEIINFIAPTFQNNLRQFTIASNLVKMMAFFLPCVSVAALAMGGLNSKKIFFLPAMAPASFNVVMIIAIFFLTAYLHSNGLEPIYALGIGVLFGGMTQFFVQLPFLIKNGFELKARLSLFSPQVKRILKRLGLGTIGIAATQINLLINTFLATSAGVGAVSFLSFGMRLFQFPVGILGVSISGANLVYFSEKWKKGELEQAKDILQSSYFLSLFVMLPATIFLYFYSRDLVFLIFERGSFDAVAGESTAIALRCYLVGLPSYGLYKIFGPTFYAIDREKLPIGISIFSIIVNVVFCVSLTPYYGFKILALGTSISMLLNSFLQIIFINHEIKLGMKFFISTKIIRLVIVNIIIAAMTFLLKSNLENTGKSREFLATGMEMGASFFLFVAVYFILMVLLGDRETVVSVLKKMKKRIIK
jgi:putative peptidoglycan lipid II flippase